MKLNYCYLLLLVILSSCSTTQVDLGEASPYFLSLDRYKEGVVYKYYRYETPTNKDATPSADIRYYHYQLVSPDILYCDAFDAAFELAWHKKYQLKNGEMRLLNYNYVFYQDTVEAIIKENLELNWNEMDAGTAITFQVDEFETTLDLVSEQVAISDTMIENIACKQVKTIVKRNRVSPKDTTHFSTTQISCFAKGIGLFSEWYKMEEQHYHLELIEQMSVSDFENKKRKAKKRIAYIDPQNTIDESSSFKICNAEKDIGDYYNREQRGQLKGGKGAWWRILKKELKAEKLHQESGYLTYRFVVNCNGEAGRFMTEQADLNFNKKRFNKETVDHLYQIVVAQKDWLPAESKRGALDSYVYITFKLKDGKIIELLP